MPRIPSTLQNIPSPDPNWLHIRNVYERAARTINGNISFGTSIGVSGATSGPTTQDNIAGTWVTITTPSPAGTDIIIPHKLGKPANGYIVMSKNNPCDVYTSPNDTASPTQLVLRANAAGVQVTLFIV